jgi:hypothetical protein
MEEIFYDEPVYHYRGTGGSHHKRNGDLHSSSYHRYYCSSVFGDIKMTPNQYRYKCPTEGCEIDSVIVNVHEDVIEYFGFCCPFCRDHMVRDDSYQSERDKVLDEMLAALQNEGMAAWDERGYIRFIQSFRQKAGERG